MEKNKILKNTTIYAIGDIIPRIVSFFIFPILTSYLSPADFGIVNYVNVINVFLSMVSLLCVNVYYLVHYYRLDSQIERKRLLGNLSLFVIGINVWFTLIVCVIGIFFLMLLVLKYLFSRGLLSG